MQIQLPELAEGEIYLCGFVSANGDVTHTILLPGDSDDASWEDQVSWAKSIGGELPTRVEQALLWANCRESFQKDLYWSAEVYGSSLGWAWCQNFSNGGQGTVRKHSKFRARAVRRLSI
ncbi:DUF1566 domain-containing protein [Burkholderia gladioli]|uniref:DUF1566 domain-containing protein n=1 Tax=Burkholderia gladioli TaxID=28095 RepID=UPI000F5306C7|nr:DUF1566 domain-containing protein [Burkholderia gladioli]